MARRQSVPGRRRSCSGWVTKTLSSCLNLVTLLLHIDEDLVLGGHAEFQWRLLGGAEPYVPHAELVKAIHRCMLARVACTCLRSSALGLCDTCLRKRSVPEGNLKCCLRSRSCTADGTVGGGSACFGRQVKSFWRRYPVHQCSCQ